MNWIVRKLCVRLGVIVLAAAWACLAGPSRAADRPVRDAAGPKDKAATTKPAKPPRPLTEAELDKLLTKLAKELGTIRTLWVDFRQDKYLSMFSDVIKAEGVCLFRRPATVRFELTKPFRSVMITKGKAVAKFEFVGSRWRKIKLANTDVIRMVTGQIASWLQGKFREKGDIYKISAVAGLHTTLILTPRNKSFRKYISSIELLLADDRKRIVSVTIREPEGDYTVMRFSREQRDVPLPDELFDTRGKAPAPLPPRKDQPTTRPAAGPAKAPTSMRRPSSTDH